MSARAWTAFAAVSFLWGIPYLFISVAVDDGVPPGFLAWARVLLGALVLIPLAWRAGLLGSLRGRIGWLTLYAIAEITIPFPLIAFGEQHISSSVAAILIAATPLIVAVLAIGFDQSERVQGRRLVGLWIGFAGVVALVGVDIAGNGDEVVGAIAILFAAIGYAAGPMMLKSKLGDLDPRAIMAGALTIATLLLTPLAAVNPPGRLDPGRGDRLDRHPRPLLHSGGLRPLRRARRRGRRRPRTRDHLHRARGRTDRRGRGAERIARPRCVARAAADHRRLVAGHGKMIREPSAAGPGAHSR